jgi:glyoxylase-like metal-dependent hydrolase (beta-lactamase superfamily II)
LAVVADALKAGSRYHHPAGKRVMPTVVRGLIEDRLPEPVVAGIAGQLLTLDTRYGAPFAAEAAGFAASLGKPITRVYVSHAHPDHFSGAGAFNAPVHALPKRERYCHDGG